MKWINDGCKISNVSFENYLQWEFYHEDMDRKFRSNLKLFYLFYFSFTHLFSFFCILHQLTIYLSSIFQHRKKIYLKCGNRKLIVLIIHDLRSCFLLIYNESSFLLLHIHIYLDIFDQLKNVNFIKNEKFHFLFSKCFLKYDLFEFCFSIWTKNSQMKWQIKIASIFI
jgi:hypothetical protein